MQDKYADRVQRQFDRLQRRVPLSSGFLGWMRRPSARPFRMPLGVLLVLGGIFSFLPVLGIWMLPLGLLLLALDVRPLQGPVGCAIVRGTRKWSNWQRGRRRS